MPLITFLNLSEAKQKEFTQAALAEFSSNLYDTASINTIIKNLGIARGSVYRYFKDKLDLWLYLKEYSEQKKLFYIQKVDRSKFNNFWEYYEALYLSGIEFDLAEPHCSRFLYQVGFKENSKEVLPFLKSWDKKAKEVFTQWVNYEKELGTFNPSIKTDIIVHFLITQSQSIAKLMQDNYEVDFEKNLQEGKSLFADNSIELKEAVKELISLLKKALS